MSRFLRKFRWESLSRKRLRKYLVYAAGEIILVVIGILIALQVNSWKNQRQLEKKEIQYLLQIRDNLQQDTGNLNNALAFNQEKIQAIKDTYQIFGTIRNRDSLAVAFAKKMIVLPNFRVFIGTRTAFDNMLNANSIDLISDQDLRQALSAYYSNLQIEYGTQERVVMSNRNFVDYVSQSVVTKEFLSDKMDAKLDLPENKTFSLHQDPVAAGSLFQLYMVTTTQDLYLKNTRETVEKLTQMIDNILTSRGITQVTEVGVKK